MFEQSMVVAGPASRWPMFSSLMLQATGVGILLLIPLIWVEQLPAIQSLPPEVFAPRTLKPMKVFAEGVIRRTPSPLTERRLFVPTQVPTLVPRIDDRPIIDDDGPLIAVGSGRSNLDSLFDGVPHARPLDAPPPPPPAKPVETKPAAAPPKTVTVASSLQASKLIHQVKPAYPDIAKRASIQGSVRLHAVIAQDGSVQRLQVASGHPLLVAAAVEAVKQWRYSPTLLGGNPVEVVTQIDVNFVLAR